MTLLLIGTETMNNNATTKFATAKFAILASTVQGSYVTPGLDSTFVLFSEEGEIVGAVRTHDQAQQVELTDWFVENRIKLTTKETLPKPMWNTLGNSVKEVAKNLKQFRFRELLEGGGFAITLAEDLDFSAPKKRGATDTAA